jgi:hypothetical protein
MRAFVPHLARASVLLGRLGLLSVHVLVPVSLALQ